MKKLFFLAIFACFTYFGTEAQTTPGNSTYGHSHKKVKKTKKAKKQYPVLQRQDADRKAINAQHKTAIKTIKSNDALTNQQQKTMVKQANTTHKVDMRRETLSNKKPRKK